MNQLLSVDKRINYIITDEKKETIETHREATKRKAVLEKSENHNIRPGQKLQMFSLSK